MKISLNKLIVVIQVVPDTLTISIIASSPSFLREMHALTELPLRLQNFTLEFGQSSIGQDPHLCGLHAAIRLRNLSNILTPGEKAQRFPFPLSAIHPRRLLT